MSSGYLSEDTIVSRVSGSGGAVSVVRISGPQVLEILSSLCPGVKDFHPRTLELAVLRNVRGEAMDDSLVAFFRGPRSFTGEDVAEFFLHGGGFVVSTVMKDLLERGCRQALPGEFSFRAVRNGKMTLDQAQAVHDLVSATNSSAHGLALERLSGAQSRAFLDLAESLRRILALTEAGIDFSDQDLDELEMDALKRPIPQVVSRMQSIASSIDRGRRIQEGVSLVLAGVPNAGKSTLFNELLGNERSLISDEAGTTRDVIREAVRFRSAQSGEEATFIVHDTAGLRKTQGRVEQMGIDLTRRTVAESDLVLFVLDPHAIEAAREEWLLLGEPREKAVVVLNKADLLPGGALGREAESLIESLRSDFGVREVLPVSALHHEGIPSVLDHLLGRVREWTIREKSEVVLTRQEQVDAVQRAVQSLERGLQSQSHDVLAADLRQALDHLSFFIGKTAVDDVLGRIFSQFCIGK